MSTNRAFEVDSILIDEKTGLVAFDIDPITVGFSAPIGSLGMRTNGLHYRKTGAANIDWTLIDDQTASEIEAIVSHDNLLGFVPEEHFLQSTIDITLSQVSDSGALAALDTVGTSQIDNNAVSLAKMADIATLRILGRIAASTGNPEVLTPANVRTIINVEDNAKDDQTAGEIEAIVSHDNLLDFLATEHFLQSAISITLSQVSDSGALAALNTVGTSQIDNNAVDLTKLLDIATSRILGRITASTGNPEVLTPANVRTIINVEDGATADQTKADIDALNIDADTLDGVDGANYARTEHKYHTFVDEEYSYDDYQQKKFLRLFTENSGFDTIRFETPSNVEYWDFDGGPPAWVAWSGGDVEIKKILDGREDITLSLDHIHRKFRFEITRNTTWPTSVLIVLQSTWTSISYTPTTVTIETWGGSSWDEKSVSIFGPGTTGSAWGTHAKAEASLHDGRNPTRFTIDVTDWVDTAATTYPLRRLMLLSNFAGRPLAPWTWDFDKRVAFRGSISLVGDLTLSGTVDGIDIATDVAANTAKVSNANHTGQVAGSGALALQVSAITEQTALTSGPADTDELLLNDNGVLKRIDLSVLRELFSPRVQTEIATTSGSSHTIGGIPSWATRVTVMCHDIRVNGNYIMYIRLGDSGGLENTGYSSVTNNNISGITFITGFSITVGAIAVQKVTGTLILTKMKDSTNKWTATGTFARTDINANSQWVAGIKSLSGDLTQIGLVTSAGNFNNGSFNISWE